MIVFTKSADPDNHHDKVNVRMEITDPDAPLIEVLEAFKEFLLGCGYVINGELDIIEEEQETYPR